MSAAVPLSTVSAGSHHPRSVFRLIRQTNGSFFARVKSQRRFLPVRAIRAGGAGKILSENSAREVGARVYAKPGNVAADFGHMIRTKLRAKGGLAVRRESCNVCVQWSGRIPAPKEAYTWSLT
jgi:hypothetical protein